jgi:hypothetical protein
MFPDSYLVFYLEPLPDLPVFIKNPLPNLPVFIKNPLPNLPPRGKEYYIVLINSL